MRDASLPMLNVWRVKEREENIQRERKTFRERERHSERETSRKKQRDIQTETERLAKRRDRERDRMESGKHKIEVAQFPQQWNIIIGARQNFLLL